MLVVVLHAHIVCSLLASKMHIVEYKQEIGEKIGPSHLYWLGPFGSHPQPGRRKRPPRPTRPLPPLHPGAIFCTRKPSHHPSKNGINNNVNLFPQPCY